MSILTFFGSKPAQLQPVFRDASDEKTPKGPLGSPLGKRVQATPVAKSKNDEIKTIVENGITFDLKPVDGLIAKRALVAEFANLVSKNVGSLVTSKDFRFSLQSPQSKIAALLVRYAILKGQVENGDPEERSHALMELNRVIDNLLPLVAPLIDDKLDQAKANLVIEKLIQGVDPKQNERDQIVELLKSNPVLKSIYETPKSMNELNVSFTKFFSGQPISPQDDAVFFTVVGEVKKAKGLELNVVDLDNKDPEVLQAAIFAVTKLTDEEKKLLKGIIEGKLSLKEISKNSLKKFGPFLAALGIIAGGYYTAHYALVVAPKVGTAAASAFVGLKALIGIV